jgi:hypothetical protein
MGSDPRLYNESLFVARETMRSSRTLLNLSQAIIHQIPGDDILHIYPRDSLKSHVNSFLILIIH